MTYDDLIMTATAYLEDGMDDPKTLVRLLLEEIQAPPAEPGRAQIETAALALHNARRARAGLPDLDQLPLTTAADRARSDAALVLRSLEVEPEA